MQFIHININFNEYRKLPGSFRNVAAKLTELQAIKSKTVKLPTIPYVTCITYIYSTVYHCFLSSLYITYSTVCRSFIGGWWW